MANPLWTVVLAAGAGRRLADVTGGIPKQFWRGVNGRSLLEQTIDRFSPLAPPSRTVVVVDATHRAHMADSERRRFGRIVYQPGDRGTAAGVLLALTPVLESAADSVVAITPSDHGVIEDARFRDGVLEASRYTRSHGAIVLFGVRPSVALHDYGWITPGPPRASGAIRAVSSFVEKPTPERAAQLFEAGAVWNTMVLVGQARAIWDLYAEVLPELGGVFKTAVGLPRAERDDFLASVYPSLPTFDFSRDVIAPARNLVTYIWPASMGWSDLGTPERLNEWQSRPSAVRPDPLATTAA
ncbi:MAG TPA: sugar phosphate nucleotidyltransferase [Vicinamibacterales bacterium]|nr:sugar phosphate nucleotidyltransferase [Vicinamibacterales bacterium]